MSEWEYPPVPLESPIAREEGAGRPNSELKLLNSISKKSFLEKNNVHATKLEKLESHTSKLTFSRLNQN